MAADKLARNDPTPRAKSPGTSTMQRKMQISNNRLAKYAARLGLMSLSCLVTLTAHAESTVLSFETHAAYFSNEMSLPTPLDPQAFVVDASSAPAVGPQQIRHAAGVRNARIADVSTLPVLNAIGKPLDMSLGTWLGARGEVVLTPLPNGTEKITAVLSHLVPRGHYSLFENHFDQKPTGFTPLDGTGRDNNFVAGPDGNAAVTLVAPAVLTHANAVLVVYHSDGKTHGQSRGEIGVSAHHQLIAQPTEAR